MAIAASFAGNLGQDGELKVVGQGTSLLSFSVAVSYFDKEKKTQWVRCSLFGKRAETLTPMLIKGTTVFVRGSLKIHEFESKGERKVSLECNVDDVELIGGKRDGEVGGRQQQSARPPLTRATANRPGEYAPDVGGGFADSDDVPF